MPDRLLDTNAVSAGMKADAVFERYLLRVGARGLFYTSVIVEGEVRLGIALLAGGRKRRVLAGALNQVLGSMRDVLPVTREVASRYSKIKSELWARGKLIGENDLWIAATALAHKLVLVTADRSFRDVGGLPVEDWRS